MWYSPVSDSDLQLFIPRGPSSVTGGNVCLFKNSVTVHNKYRPDTLDRLWNVTRGDTSSCGKTNVKHYKHRP